MKIIFLDIDGVMNNESHFPSNCCVDPIGEEHLDLLEIIIEQTEAQIVLSSTWRLDQNLKQKVVDHLSKKNLQLLDSTICLGHLPRSREIEDWLLKNTSVESFVILDDDDDACGNYKSNFVETTFKRGLTPALAYKAVQILNKEEDDES